VQVKSARSPTITTEEYARLAAFRLALRTFLHFSEEAAAQVGLTGQHYQALLILRARPPDQPFTINDLAQQLFLKHNSTVALVDRLEADGLLVRVPSSVDRRKVELRITARGSRVLGKLAERHRGKLKMIGPELEAFFRELSRADVAARQDAPKPARRRTAAGPRATR
jgi:DNA-binding MarR family transcriptional regulator